jgi:hypothetical protein
MSDNEEIHDIRPFISNAERNLSRNEGENLTFENNLVVKNKKKKTKVLQEKMDSRDNKTSKT